VRAEIGVLLQRVVSQLPGAEVREGQLSMAVAVAEVLGHDTARGGATVAVAAGTGTGKSFAYLVPVVVSGKKVVVATATKALQDQLASKDLPLVAKGLGSRFRWAVLKGRSNYLCRQRLAEMEQLGRQTSLEESLGRRASGSTGKAIGEQVAKLVEWSGRTGSGVKGTRMSIA
jgi:ATP-dependent DNA helicase DinG